MKVKLTERVGNRQVGEVIDVDSASAKSLVDTKMVATYVDEPPAVPPAAAPARRGNVVSRQVADEDNPNTPADDDDSDETGEGDDEEDGDGGETSAGS